MFIEEFNKIVTVLPEFDQPDDGRRKFKWHVHFSLPFPFPSRECVNISATDRSRSYSFGIHNHLDRIYLSRKGDTGLPCAFLHEKKTWPSIVGDGCTLHRESLIAVAEFRDDTIYSTADDAFSDAGEKLHFCIEFLSLYLAKCQKVAPFACGWLVYPLSAHDFGVIHHGTLFKRDDTPDWEPHSSAQAFVLGRNLQKPLFFIEPPDPLDELDPILETPYELLAEGLHALCRGLPRLAVLNSYNAVELLANNVFSKLKTEFLVSNNMPQQLAEKTVEEERQRHRNEMQFLVHKGLKGFASRSLPDEKN